jgi:phosphoribosyl-ATP pyrophosphohydrolase
MKKMSTPPKDNILNRLYQVILERKQKLPADSYVALLCREGIESIHAKIAEEVQEVIVASRSVSKEQLVHEMADLWFHCLVLLGYCNISPDQVYLELARRWGHSGLKEKSSTHGNRH